VSSAQNIRGARAGIARRLRWSGPSLRVTFAQAKNRRRRQFALLVPLAVTTELIGFDGRLEVVIGLFLEETFLQRLAQRIGGASGECCRECEEGGGQQREEGMWESGKTESGGKCGVVSRAWFEFSCEELRQAA